LTHPPLSDRAVRDGEPKPEIERVFAAPLSVCGAREIWRQMRREGFDIARCTVARLMRCIGIEDVIRGKSREQPCLTRRCLARCTGRLFK
jgi:putative transposase